MKHLEILEAPRTPGAHGCVHEPLMSLASVMGPLVRQWHGTTLGVFSVGGAMFAGLGLRGQVCRW
jgi:hypothetical protein